MKDPITSMLRRGAGRDPRECRTDAELDAVMREMLSRSQEQERYVESIRGGVPVVLGELQRTIALGQLDQMRRLAR